MGKNTCWINHDWSKWEDVQTGKPQFIVGEPRRPGGPPAPERLSIKPLPMSVRGKAA